MTDEKKFDPERARADAIASLNKASLTLAANAAGLLPLVMSHLGAPSEMHAKSAIAMAIKILLLLETKIADAPIGEVNDAQQKLDEAMKRVDETLRGKAH